MVKSPGTPNHNSLDDLFSLYKFCKLEPYCQYSYWKYHCSVKAKEGSITRDTMIPGRRSGAWSPLWEAVAKHLIRYVNACISLVSLLLHLTAILFY